MNTPKDNTLLDIHSDKEYALVIISRIWEKIKAKIKIDDNGCWNYEGSHSWSGYGRMSIKVNLGFKKSKVVSFSTHKFVFRYFRGTVSEYELIRHMCNNRKCCNPAHLEKGSFLDNALDIIRNKRNERHTAG